MSALADHRYEVVGDHAPDHTHEVLRSMLVVGVEPRHVWARGDAHTGLERGALTAVVAMTYQADSRMLRDALRGSIVRRIVNDDDLGAGAIAQHRVERGCNGCFLVISGDDDRKTFGERAVKDRRDACLAARGVRRKSAASR